MTAAERSDARTGAGYREVPNETPTDRGGHFAAMDSPDLLVGDLRTFFRRFR